MPSPRKIARREQIKRMNRSNSQKSGVAIYGKMSGGHMDRDGGYADASGSS